MPTPSSEAQPQTSKLHTSSGCSTSLASCETGSWSAADLDSIEHHLRMWEKRGPKTWLANTNASKALLHVWLTMQGKTSSTCVKIGNAFLMYQIGLQWWADRPILAEELLFSLDDQPIDMQRVTAFMEETARLHGCAGVAIGTSLVTHDATYSRYLGRYGYATEAHVNYKEVT